MINIEELERAHCYNWESMDFKRRLYAVIVSYNMDNKNSKLFAMLRNTILRYGIKDFDSLKHIDLYNFSKMKNIGPKQMDMLINVINHI